MSLFFTEITDIFNNQTRDNDFDLILNHYKDKTFRFKSMDFQPQNNCLLSYDENGIFDEEKTLDLMADCLYFSWFEEWRQNNYDISRFPINISEQDKDDCLNELQNNNLAKNNINRIRFKNNWKLVLNQIKNHVNINNTLNNIEDFNNIELKVFKKMIIDNIKNYIRATFNTPDEYLDEFGKYLEWKKIPLNENYKIFDDKIDCTNVEQGALGTCYFLEAISTLSNYGQLLYQLFPNENIKNDGFYEICLFHKGKWVKVLIDDYFLFYKGTNYFVFTQPIQKCLYSCFLEKAYAKIKVSFANIN